MSDALPLQPAQRVAGVAPYQVPRHPAPIDLDLRGNEGAVPDPDLWPATLDPEVLRRYPDPSGVQARLAARFGVRPDRVLVTAGGDDGLDRLCRAVLEPGRTAVLPAPGFEMTRRYARLAGAEVVAVPWPGAAFPVDAVVAACGPDTGLVAVTSPNNPTGAVISRDGLERVCAAARAVGAVVLVDLAYVEFADDDLTPAALAHDHVVVLRTLSKAAGLAGLRVGCMLGHPTVLGWMKAAGAPYAVASPSLAVAARSLDAGDAAMARFVEDVRAGRARIAAALRAAGCAVVPSQANFVFARRSQVGWMADGLAGLGVGVRTFAGQPDLADAVRVACPPSAAGVDRFCAALSAVTAPQALLLDLDGVLADVSGSYRAAIIAAAADLGVTVTPADITAAKAAGDANNDWVVTQRLLAVGGVSAPLDAVTAAFERHYQGSPDQPGLHTTERLIGAPDRLARLAARLPVAIVTGRPRADARRFLDQHGLSPHLSALVCMEDGPPKPDPAPVRAALEALGVQRAWMVGDTPDDLRAARAAGVVPLGVRAPGEPDAAPLWAAGAARVLDSLADLDALLDALPPLAPRTTP